VKSVYELWGEEYLSDGEWQAVQITSGSLKHCKEIKEDAHCEYRGMYITKA